MDDGARRQDEGRRRKDRGRTDGRGRRRRSAPVRGSESTVESTKREMKGSTMAGGRGECFGELHQNNDGTAWGGQEDL